MKTHHELWMRAPAATVYRLAAEVERWPELLPHYRWVTVLERAGRRKLVEMAASRDGIPVRWQAVQELDPDTLRIAFTHVAGITRGMAATWTFVAHDGGTLVRLDHDLTLRWPLVGGWVADRVVGPQFVANIAGKTLRRIKELAEAAEARRASQPTQPAQGRRATRAGGARP